jgi:hypothetical protein
MTAYSIASGATGYIGLFKPTIPVQTVLVGDSLTDPNGYNLSPFHDANGMSGGLLQPIINAGYQGNTIGDLLARIDNPYTNPSITRGLAGAPALGWGEIRIGTNNARASAFGGLASAYDTLFPKLLGYANFWFVKPVLPIGGPEVAANANVAEFNTYLAAKCAASGGRLIWIDDGVNVRDGSGNQLAAFFLIDGVHLSPRGVWQCALDSAAAMAAALAPYSYASPVSADPADKYPAQPQWNTNHTNIGTAGGMGSNFTGTVPDNWYVGPNGGGIAGVCSIVAAVGGDANTAPWLRVQPTQVTRTGAGETVRLGVSLAERTITTSDPTALELVYQIRLTNFDSDKMNVLTSWVQANTGDLLCPVTEVKMGGGLLTKTLTMRAKMPRQTAVAATSATLFMDLVIAANGTGLTGTFDVRCFTIRG